MCTLDGMRQFAAYGCEHYPRKYRSTENTKYEIEKEEGKIFYLILIKNLITKYLKP